MDGEETTMTTIVRWTEGAGKVDFLLFSLCHSGIGEKDTHNASVVGTRGA